jgi:hypothetical protein
MATRTADTLKQFEAEYGENPLMVEAVSELDTTVASIHETLGDRSRTKVSAATLETREAERQMVEPCVELANAMSVIGFKRNNKELITLQGLSEHSLYNLGGNSALVLAKEILDTAKKYPAELQTCAIGDVDKLMVLYKKSIFYDEYRTARNIIFPNEGKSKKPVVENQNE